MAQKRKNSRSAPKSTPAKAGLLAGRLRAVMGLSLKALAPVVVLALGIVSFVGLKATKPEVPQRPASEQVWAVKSVEADVKTYRPDLILYGRTVAGRRVELRSLVAGEIIETGNGMREGAVVKKGDLLLKIDPFQFEGALDEATAKLAEAKARLQEIEATLASEQDALKHARTQHEIAKRDLQRAIPLAEKGTVTKKLADDRRMVVSEREQGVEQRFSNVEIQQARAGQQRAVISQLEWGVRQARRNLEDTVLTAPFDAYVTGVTAEEGRIVGANDQVATLIDAGWVDVRFTLSDRQYGRIVASERSLEGRELEVLWHVGDTPVSYAARIERVGAEITAEKGGVEIFARITTPSKPIPIRPGAFVEVRMPDRAYERVTRLPQTSIYESSRVYAIEDGRLKSRNISLVGAAGGDVLVRGNIEQGDRIMTTRLSAAADGVRVEEQ